MAIPISAISHFLNFLYLKPLWNIVKPLNSGHALNSGQNVQSQIWQSMLNYLPIAGTSQKRTNFLRPAGVHYLEVSLYQNQSFNLFYDFLGCPRPTSGHEQGGKLSQQLSITKLLLIWPEGYQEPRYEVASRILARHISEIRIGNLVLRLTRYPIVLIEDLQCTA